MRKRVFLGALVATVLTILSARPVQAQTVYEIREDAAPGGNVFRYLDDLREAISNGTVTLGQGDEIVLYNDDDSLLAPISANGDIDITVRSASGTPHTIKRPAGGYVFSFERLLTDPAIPNLNLDNIRVANDQNSVGDGLYYHNAETDRRTVTISDSEFTNLRRAIYLEGNVDASLTDTIIKDNGTGIRTDDLGQNLNLDIAFTENAAYTTRWNNSITAETGVGGTTTVTVDVVEGKVFDQRASLRINGQLVKTGGGVYKIGWNNGYSTVTHTDIREGTMHFRTGIWGDLSGGNTMSVRSGAVFKVTMTPGQEMTDWFEGKEDSSGSSYSTFWLDSFAAEDGARLEIGDISKFPVIPHAWHDGTTSKESWLNVRMINVGVGNTGASYIPDSMNIDNKLLTAKWYAVDWEAVKDSNENIEDLLEDMDDADKDSFMLQISRVENLQILDGVGAYADAYRKMNLTDVERDMLDSIYARGGANGHDLGFLQTLGGHVVQNAMLALRNNQLDLLRRINRRLTAYQKEELELVPGITGGEHCYYTDVDPVIDYGELWAYMDAAFDVQDDVGDVAGYRFNRYGLGVGYDWHIDQLIVGGALSFTMGDMKLKSQSATKTDIKNLIAAVYASWASEGWYISGSAFAGYGWNDSVSAYNLVGASPAVGRTGDYGTSTVGVGLEVGYMMETFLVGIPVRVTPYGSLSFARTTRNAVREHGAILNDGESDIDLNRQFRSGRWNAWDGALGFRLTAPIDRANYTLLPNLDIAWIRNGGNAGSKYADASFIRDPSASWSLPVAGPNRSALRLAAGLDARIGDRMMVGASYEFEWRKRATRHRFNVNFSLGF